LTYHLEKDIQKYIKENFVYSEGVFTRKSNGKIVGTKQNHGYIQCSIKTKNFKIRILLHKLIFLYHYGYIPKVIDHIDRDKSNNKIENLREATKSLNEANTGPRPKNKSGYKGVCWHRAAKKWRVTLREKHYGLFEDLKEAVDEYNKLSKEVYGEFAYHQPYGKIH